MGSAAAARIPSFPPAGIGAPTDFPADAYASEKIATQSGTRHVIDAAGSQLIGDLVAHSSVVLVVEGVQHLIDEKPGRRLNDGPLKYHTPLLTVDQQARWRGRMPKIADMFESAARCSGQRAKSSRMTRRISVTFHAPFRPQSVRSIAFMPFPQGYLGAIEARSHCENRDSGNSSK